MGYIILPMQPRTQTAATMTIKLESQREQQQKLGIFEVKDKSFGKRWEQETMTMWGDIANASQGWEYIT
jgi:hypothetical protein